MAAASCRRSWSAEGGAQHRVDLHALREGGVTGAEHDLLLAGLRVERVHLSANVLQEERPSSGDFQLEIEAADRVPELVGTTDAREEVLEHTAIDHGLAGHRVRIGLRETNVTDDP